MSSFAVFFTALFTRLGSYRTSFHYLVSILLRLAPMLNFTPWVTLLSVLASTYKAKYEADIYPTVSEGMCE